MHCRLSRHKTSPMTNEELVHLHLTPNLSLRQLISSILGTAREA